jgi:broad specificity phosphatase PhoE
VSDVERRAADWIGSELVLAADGDQTIFVVSHAGWIRVAVNLLLARPLTHLFDTPIEHARATIIDLYSSRVHLVAENVEEFPSFLVYEGRSDD